jgi:endonuclease-3
MPPAAKKTSKRATARAGKSQSRRKGYTPAKPTPATRKRGVRILEGLKKEYPDAAIALDFSNALELLVATILAAQCTDQRVNIVTADLFEKYRTAQDYADAPDEELIEAIRSTGFFNNKSKSIKKACRSIVDDFGGEVPGTMEELLTLAGVGRKTANCILGNVFGVPGIVVDTHMIRLSRRMGLSRQKDPDKIEFDLMVMFPRDDWTLSSHLISSHGRRWCSARKPMCDQCPVADDCPKLL